jgi:hypothetical protein
MQLVSTKQWDPPVSLRLFAPSLLVSTLSPRGCHTPMLHARALKALLGPRALDPTAARIPTMRRRQPPRHVLRRPPLSEAAPMSASDRACPTRHATDADRPLPPPPRQLPLSRACPHRRPRLAVRTPSSPTPPVRRGVVAFAAPLCRPRAVVYTPSSRRAAVHAPVRPRRALPRTASRASVTSPPRSTCATSLRRAHARAGPSWARPWAAHAALAEADPARLGHTHCAGRLR